MLKRLKLLLSGVYHFVRSSSYRRLRCSTLFQNDYYLQRYPDVAKAGGDPLLHYLNFGYKEKRQPGPFFEPDYYMQQVPELKTCKVDPLSHYLIQGYKSELMPNPFFDPVYYLRQKGGSQQIKKNPYLHFLSNHTTTTRPIQKTPFFDPHYYCNIYPDVRRLKQNPFVHYLRTGLREGRSTSPWFDSAWYQDRHNLSSNPVSHYLIRECSENKSPNPFFDPKFYRERYRIDEGEDPFEHYLNRGLSRDYQPCNWFEPLFYRETYLRQKSMEQVPLLHFMEKGRKNRNYPNSRIRDFAVKPVISILVPVYNADLKQLNSCIRSVINQSYPHWELCLVDDCSTDETIRPRLEEWSQSDDRIRISFLEENKGISAATNKAASLASGEYLGFLDNDDELHLEALEVVVDHINREDGDLYYSDEDLIGVDGRQHSIFRKPAFNLELLRSHNYITHFVVVRYKLFSEVGGCDSRRDGAQDLDLLLKLSETAGRIVHIPRILYHWRATASSTSINHDQKNYANEAGRKAVENSMKRGSLAARVDFTDLNYYYRTRRKINTSLTTDVIVYIEPHAQNPLAWLNLLLTGLQQRHPGTRIMVTGAIDPGISGTEKISSHCKDRLESFFSPARHLSPAKALNDAAMKSSADLLVFLSSDVTVCGDNWLGSMIEHGQREEVGMVGGLIECADEKFEPVVPVPDISDDSPVYYFRYLTSSSILLNGRHCPQEVLGVYGNFCMMKREDLLALGGANDRDYPYLFWSLDLCYRMYLKKKINLFTPYSRAIWSGEGRAPEPSCDHLLLDREKRAFQKEHAPVLKAGDPYYNEKILSDNNISVVEFHNWKRGLNNSEN